MRSPQSFVPALIDFFYARLPRATLTAASNVRRLGGFSDAAWGEIASDINALPAVRAAGVQLRPRDIASASTITQLATIISGRASESGAGAERIDALPDGATEDKPKPMVRRRSAPRRAARPQLDSASERAPASFRLPRSTAGQESNFEAAPGDDAVPEYPAAAAPEPAPVEAAPPDDAAPDAAGAPSERPGLTFELEGPQAEYGEAVWESSFEVVVGYGAITAGMLAGVRSRKVDAAIAGASAELEIVVLPIGFALDGRPEQPLKFENGRLVDQARFRLTAPRRADLSGLGPGPYGISVGLKKSSTLIHSFFLEIALVDSLHGEERPTPVMDFDLEEAAVTNLAPRAGILFILGEGDSWKIYWNIGGKKSRAKVASVVTPARLKAQYDAFVIQDLNAIANSAAWRNVDAGMNLPKDAANKASALAAMKAAVTAGSKLYLLLQGEDIFKEALALIEQLPDGSKIAVVTNSVAFPWELLYPLRYIDGWPAENYQPEKLWGNRFVFESLLVAATEEKYPANRQQPGKLHISMGLNGGIDLEPAWNVQPPRPLLPVKLQKDYFDATLAARGDCAIGNDRVLEALRKAPAEASLIYFFCHGTADKLEFEKAKSITPFHVFGPDFSSWALVFLNACEAGNISPLSFFSFRDEFRKRKSAGLIAPCFPIPTLFAAAFGKTFIERYAAGEAVGDIMFDLRKKLLADNNPLGLWYSLQCPLDLKAPR